MSNIYNPQPSSTGGGGSTTASDRTSFVGYRVPDEIKKTVPLIGGLDRPTFRLILTATVLAFEGKDVNLKELAAKTSAHLTEETLCVVISGLYRLLQLALRSTQKPEALKEDLTNLKIPDDFASDLLNAAVGPRRPVLMKHAKENGVHLNKLESLKWRVDVGISTSVLNRLLEPTVNMEMILTDGTIHHLEVPMNKFHELRYNVAHVLKEMEVLEKRSILKIQD